jgi:hypothetical protein
MSITLKDCDDCQLVARIDGGKYHNKRVYITMNDKNEVIKMDNPFSILTDKWFRARKPHMKSIEMARLQQAIAKQKAPYENEDIYNEAIKLINDRSKKELYLTDGKLKPTLPKNGIVRTYTAGPSESGKTTWNIALIKEIRRRHKKIKLYLFSQLSKDEDLDKLKPIRIKIDDEILEDPIAVSTFKDSIVMFDDIETIKVKKLKDEVSNLRDQCLSEGRHYNISVLCTNHQITDYKKTRNMLLECQYITFFPRSSGVYGIERLLKCYIGLGKDDIKKILSLPSRWVTIWNRAPLCCLYECGMFLLGQNSAPQPEIIEKVEKIEITKLPKIKEIKNIDVIDSDEDTDYESASESEYSD